jgi:glutamate synthase domain-containing protein 2/glutamate synthase domain-containing protein 1/glutamate synthase domain-containing protein 3
MPVEAARSGLVDPGACRASCGVGALVQLDGERSHALIEDAFTMLANLAHRGARGAEANTGDGAGMLLQKPHAFFGAELAGLPAADAYGVGQVFLPRERLAQDRLRALVEAVAADEGLDVLAWRRVPTDASELGRSARATEPAVWQCFVAPRAALAPEALDLRLYVLRKCIERRARAVLPRHPLYVCSLDRRTVVYKGLLTATQLRGYYPELADARVASALALVHSRFSTNTLGAWPLAHPYRRVVHNGEFNTLRGNKNWMRAREATLASPRLGADIDKLKPVIDDGASDSATFDNVLELLVAAGRSLPHALRMMIPEAWNKNPRREARRRAFYDYHAAIMEPWDGPALVVASDGEQVAAVLDRNGLRPCRIWLTDDRRLVLGSEAGLLDLPAPRIVAKARLRPGQLLLADTCARRIVDEDDIFAALAAAPYAQWVAENRVRLGVARETAPPDAAAREHAAACRDGALDTAVAAVHDPADRAAHDGAGEAALRDRIAAPANAADAADAAALLAHQRAFGYTLEVLERLIQPMAVDGKDPLGAMGNDTPPAVLSARRRPLFHYFSQLFAQVSNPPLDYLREALVTVLDSHLGRQRNLLDESPAHCRRLLLDSPILDAAAFAALSACALPLAVIDTTFAREQPLAAALDRVRADAEAALARGAELLVLSDRHAGPQRMPLPSLLALGAIHHHLLRVGRRTACGLIVDSGEPCAVHHFCTLIGFGADAVHPWLAYDTVARLAADGLIAGEADGACRRYRDAVEGGLLKVMAKMGISTLEGYKGAQVFEALGLDPGLLDECFAGTPCAVPARAPVLARLERETRARHAFAYAPPLPAAAPLEQGGELYWRRDGEYHAWNPYTIGRLQHAVRSGDEAAYRDFAARCNGGDGVAATLRDLLEFATDGITPVALAEVEPEEAILRRFSTGSMSFGALSREVHETLALAMNRIGGKSGTGEGGEHPERFGTERACSMKQVASGRFGVNIRYLADARQIEIKMAQGSKPGEGGELPAGKVDADIAAARCTIPGVGLISPPPHHDIYSIEDLAQLIHDLRRANPAAEIHVKLVAEAGVGTIAAGVAKAGADAVLISGESGGTGASLKTSIKSAGAPWEVGVAETQQVLLANNLRARIRVRTDGGLKTGRDVAVAALLGAEEYGFGTAPLVALGCIMLRKCHCNTCSVGIATQDAELRRHFAGRPEHVVQYFRFVARELREIIAALGFRTVDEMIGRVDRLRERRDAAAAHGVDLSRLLYRPPSDDAPRSSGVAVVRDDDSPEAALVPAALAALARGAPASFDVALRNRDRAFGARLSWAMVRHGAADGPPRAHIVVRCRGAAGQSFGAFLAPGIDLHLVGEANDYVGKGLSGGCLAVATPADAGHAAADAIVVGNVALYGATAGEAYFNGQAGERFAVRNSGALAVVEGVGDHACEYMTGGAVVVLGASGRNFGAGMSGGEAYVLDEAGDFAQCVNTETVRLEPFADARDRRLVRRLLENHLALTASARARALLARWDAACLRFVKVMPHAYAEAIARARARGRDLRPPLPAPLRGARGVTPAAGDGAAVARTRGRVPRRQAVRTATPPMLGQRR